MIELTNEPVHTVFYSFRRCPYAIRARLAITIAGIAVELREIDLKAKPEALLTISPKGTVPVLLLEQGEVLEQSLDIMLWALRRNDPGQWLQSASLQKAMQIIGRNDGDFKYYLDRYKYADRYPEHSELHYRQQAEHFLLSLEQQLALSPFLCADHFSLADAAVIPFIRQFAAVDSAWFACSPYPRIKQWLDDFLSSSLYEEVMKKYQVWQPDNPIK